MEEPKSSQETLAPEAAASDAELADATSQLGLAASSRFEFEAAKGNEGTKILLVEWDASSMKSEPVSEAETGPGVREKTGTGWEVSWPGKTATFPTRDRDTGTRKRVYFLLPPGAPVPALVTITHPNGSSLTTKPLPAIFPAELSSPSGGKGVLHTIWAKKRLSEIEDEIAKEMKVNGEGIGLEMALKEKQWLAEHFGLCSPQEPTAGSVQSPVPLAGPMSPKSPVAGKLGEKLRGLKLATSPSELTAAASAAKSRAAAANTDVQSTSPGSADLAVPSYSALSGQRPRNDAGGAASMATVLGSGNGLAATHDADNEDDLFALPMSPRSPEMKRSPFSLL